MKKTSPFKKYLEIAAIAGVIYILLKYLAGDFESFWIEAWFMLEILVLTMITRTVSLKYGFFVYTQGLVIGAGFTLLVGIIINALGLQISEGFFGGIFMPTIEEIAKILPVLIAAFITIKRHHTVFNISDFLLLSVMSGAGFSMLEKYFWEGINFSFTYGPHLGDTYFFSDALGVNMSGETVGYIGHAAATGLVGMGLGLGLYLKKRFSSAKAWWWLVPVATFGWVTFEHIIYNFRHDVSAIWFKGMVLTPWIFLALLITTLAIEGQALRKLFKQFPSIKKQTLSSFKDTASNLKKGEVSLTKITAPFRKLRLVNLAAWRIKARK
ncbi:PrsW family intramembrane metalloprotease [Candidatus Peregrinibacteria bacterium]|jgi:RsiW-degrading membrane proteinase PrsW (M82 family)|nr:PrsW family intramembrane metalloprotease [Candidatus Peregrinibacteria bacterium]MBT7483509.1 PrsW family intramembrane metalloprotease [Candidatus Peregrinibacteria bacterium]MBT7703040.1 PrsW family intramembrane metalloprotease [Candidatus Peregrinibacteria bacterium]